MGGSTAGPSDDWCVTTATTAPGNSRNPSKRTSHLCSISCIQAKPKFQTYLVSSIGTWNPSYSSIERNGFRSRIHIREFNVLWFNWGCLCSGCNLLQWEIELATTNGCRYKWEHSRHVSRHCFRRFGLWNGLAVFDWSEHLVIKRRLAPALLLQP